MIVRIFGDGQFRLDDDLLARLDELDDAVVAALDREDDDGFHERFAALLDFVRSNGDRLADDELSPSDFFLPPADVSPVEVRTEFTGEGLIPDPS